MKFINQTKNTVYLSDIDRYIYFTDMTPQFISEHDILKSKGFQKLVSLNKFLIIEAGSSRIEQNLLRIQSENSTTDIVDNAADISETDIPCHTGLEIVLKGHFLEAGGYAKVNRNLALGLLEKGVDVKVDIVGSSKVDVSENEIRDILQLRKKPSRNALHLDSIIPTYGATGTGRRKIIYTTVESSTIPKQFVESVNMYDDIWVTSNFCSDVLKKHGVSKDIFVLPDSINTDLYTPIGPKCEFKPSLKEFVFISVFGWSYRKGYDLLLKSFLKAFNGNDNVSLLIFSRFQGKTSNSNVIQKEVSKYIDEYGGDNPAHIIRCSRIIAESDMPSLYRACNAFVLFSRGEGFGLPYCEASLCGLPVIGTNCSGQTMFLNKSNSSLVDIDFMTKMQSGQMHVHYWDNQEFPSFTSDKSVNDSADILRDVYKNYKVSLKKNKILEKYLRTNYSINNISNMAYNRILHGEKR